MRHILKFNYWAFKLFVILACSIIMPRLSAQDLLTYQAPLPCLNKKFTVVAHIVKDSLNTVDEITMEAAIRTSFIQVNKWFEPICVSFEPCEFNVIENFQYDTLYDVANWQWDELMVKYRKDRRINIIFSGKIDTMENSVVSGFAAGGIANASGGVAVVRPGNPGVIAHELGHYFGLAHTFAGNGTELVDGSNCKDEGDRICDTPADPFHPDSTEVVYVNDECQFVYYGKDEKGQYYRPDVGNIMSYYPCPKCGFTYEQYLKMANSWLNSDRRVW